MKYCVYNYTGRRYVGVVSPDHKTIWPLNLSAEEAQVGISALLDRETSPEVLHDQAIALSDVELDSPLPRPRRNIFCVGKNYSEHAREFAASGFDSSATAGVVPAAPIVFSKVPETVIRHGDAIRIDSSVSAAVDYEAELAVIIGKGGRRIPRSSAMDHVWGYTIVNDVTARDLQGRHSQWLLGKSQDTFCPMGPWAVTRDEFDLGSSDIRCYVNEELRQSSNTSLLIFDVPHLIETISAGITLKPGDVIATGTPAGVGIGFDPPKYLVPGDRVRIEIQGIGTLENPVI